MAAPVLGYRSVPAVPPPCSTAALHSIDLRPVCYNLLWAGEVKLTERRLDHSTAVSEGPLSHNPAYMRHSFSLSCAGRSKWVRHDRQPRAEAQGGRAAHGLHARLGPHAQHRARVRHLHLCAGLRRRCVQVGFAGGRMLLSCCVALRPHTPLEFCISLITGPAHGTFLCVHQGLPSVTQTDSGLKSAPCII